MTIRAAELERRHDGAFVTCELHDGLKPADLLLVERLWSPFRGELMNRLLRARVPRHEWPESLHWDWAQKGQELSQLAAAGFGVLLSESWQGLMLTKSVPYYVGRLAEHRNKPLVYVDFIEAAPWNWKVPSVGQVGEYKGTGSILFREAVVLSLEEEFRGRVGLHSLPKAEAFYRGIGMTDLGPDPEKQNLRYFELSENAAQIYLTTGGEI